MYKGKVHHYSTKINMIPKLIIFDGFTIESEIIWVFKSLKFDVLSLSLSMLYTQHLQIGGRILNTLEKRTQHVLDISINRKLTSTKLQEESRILKETNDVHDIAIRILDH